MEFVSSNEHAMRIYGLVFRTKDKVLRFKMFDTIYDAYEFLRLNWENIVGYCFTRNLEVYNV